MIEVKQRSRDSGDCMSATLASLLHLSIDNVPVFKGEDWFTDINVWLKQFGLAYVILHEFKDYAANNGISDCYHTVCGPSISGTANHMCVGKDGELIFDPYDSTTTILKSVETCGVFIMLEPHLALEKL